jgi:HEAT repeat protein/energy-coupling factor transporter ATP-binding protein EcfA2
MSAVPDICFVHYLTSLVAEYKQWWRLYTLTDATSRAREQEECKTVLFDFGLMVQTVQAPAEPQERQESEQKKEKIERLPVLEGIRKYAAEHVLLVGRPGSGKSTALARLLLDEAQKALADRQSAIPVLIELRYLPSEANQRSVIDRIQAFIQKHDPSLNLDEEAIKSLLRQGRLLLLCDGLNELPSEKGRSQVSAFRQDYEKSTPAIFTTRDLSVGGDLGIKKRLEMQPLTEPQMQQFVKAYLPEQGEKMLRQLGGRLREFGQTPLLLWMLCSLFKQSECIPNSLGLVFRTFTQGYGNKIEQDLPLSREWWARLLQYLAFAMIQGNNLVDARVVISRQEAERILIVFLQGKVEYPDDCAIRWLQHLLKHHLIQENVAQIEFCHQLIQEYYAAEYLLGLLPHLSDAKLKHEFLNYLKWTEPLALMLELVEDERQVLWVVQLAMNVDLKLGAELAGKTKLSLQRTTVNLLIQQNFTIPLTIRLLEQTKSCEALPFLIDIAKNGCPETRWRAVRSLNSLADKDILIPLIEALKDPDSTVRFMAAKSLGKLGKSEATPYLCQLLDDENWLVRSACVEALGELERMESYECLKSALKHEDYTVRTKAAEYLGRCIPQEVVILLNEEFSNSDNGSKKKVIQLLGETKSLLAIPILIHALQEDDWVVRSEAVMQIGLLGIWINKWHLEESLTPFIHILQNDPQTSVRSCAAIFLGVIGDYRIVPILIEALAQNDTVVRSSIINALEQLRDRSAIKSIINSLQDDEYVCEAAIKALRTFIAKEALPGIRKLARSKVVNIRREVIYTLGFIGDSEDLPCLYKALHDKEFSIRLSAAYSLSLLDNRKGVSVLEEALVSGNKDAREIALSGLKNFKGKVGLSSILSNVFRDDESSIRSASVDFLKSFKEEHEVIKQLMIALHSQHEDVCRNAMDAAAIIGNSDSLSRLRQLSETITDVERPLEATAAIQARCKYYNYAITQTPLPETDTSNIISSGNTIINIKEGATVEKLILGDNNVRGDDIREQKNYNPPLQ